MYRQIHEQAKWNNNRLVQFNLGSQPPKKSENSENAHPRSKYSDYTPLFHILEYVYQVDNHNKIPPPYPLKNLGKNMD